MKRIVLITIITAFLALAGLAPLVSQQVAGSVVDYLIGITNAHAVSLDVTKRIGVDEALSTSRLFSLDQCLKQCIARDKLCCDKPQFALK